ncbi:30S ribosomal protein S11, partial [Salmonella enterica]
RGRIAAPYTGLCVAAVFSDTNITDMTPIPHDCCRPPKKRRV